MTSLVVDDELGARERILRLLTAHPEVVAVGEAQNGHEAVEKIEKLRPDLVFLDIELPGMSGFEVLESVQSTIPLPLVVFVTGYDQHALAAFEANALAYLLKPVEPERLTYAVERAMRLNAGDYEKQREREHLLRVARQAPKLIRHVVCRKGDRLLLIPPENILWFFVEDGIVKAKTLTDSYRVNYQLGELAASLPQELFFRARREVLINLSLIKEIRPYFKSGLLLVMSNSPRTEIIVSERQIPLLRQRIPGL